MRTLIFALPFAGGNQYSYRKIEFLLPSKFEWINLELPGRGNRIMQDLTANIDEIMIDVFRQFKHVLKDSPYIIYGHSMGTIIGYELTKIIYENNLKPPLFLFFTGRGGPSSIKEEKISNLEGDIFWKKLQEKGGIPKEFMENKELIELFEPILKSDFKLVEEYIYKPQNTKFDIPVFIRKGSDENKITFEKITAWQIETSIPINTGQIPGSHFFILEHPEILVSEIELAYDSLKIR